MGCASLRGLGQLQGVHVPGGKGTNGSPSPVSLLGPSGPGREPRPARPRGDDPSQLHSTLRNQTHVLM